jgi:hypothetical protein
MTREHANIPENHSPPTFKTHQKAKSTGQIKPEKLAVCCSSKQSMTRIDRLSSTQNTRINHSPKAERKKERKIEMSLKAKST